MDTSFNGDGFGWVDPYLAVSIKGLPNLPCLHMKAVPGTSFLRYENADKRPLNGFIKALRQNGYKKSGNDCTFLYSR
jgi:hypothetical protein